MNKVRRSYETELLQRILCDYNPRKSPDAIYLVTEHDDNRLSVIGKARDMWAGGLKNNRSISLILVDAETDHGYSGFDSWYNQLTQLGVGPEYIHKVILPSHTPLNTLTESQAVVRFAHRSNILTLYQVAWGPVHQPRAFMTLASETLRVYPSLKIYSVPGVTLPWNERVHHSQGTGPFTRIDWIGEEQARIRKYRKKGDLFPVKDILAYMDWRDRRR